MTEHSVNVIRDRVLDLTLKPGERVSEKQLMEQFGLSRTPAREALNRLATEGLIDFRRNQGAYVHPLDLGHVRQLFEGYIALERLVGFLCLTRQAGLVEDLERLQSMYDESQTAGDFLTITRRNSAFHNRLAASTRNEYVMEFAARLYNLARRVSFYIYSHEKNHEFNLQKHGKLINRDHEDIIACIRENDNTALIEVMTRHAVLFRDRITGVFSLSLTEEFPVAADAYAKAR